MSLDRCGTSLLLNPSGTAIGQSTVWQLMTGPTSLVTAFNLAAKILGHEIFEACIQRLSAHSNFCRVQKLSLHFLGISMLWRSQACFDGSEGDCNVYPYFKRYSSLQKLADFMRWDSRQHKQEEKDPSALNLSQCTDYIYWHPSLKSLANRLLLPRCTMMSSASRTLPFLPPPPPPPKGSAGKLLNSCKHPI